MNLNIHRRGIFCPDICRRPCSRYALKLLLTMKLTILLLTVVFMQAANAAFSQQITIHVENASLRSVLSTIKKQSGYRVLYSTEVLERSVPVTLQLKNATFGAGAGADLRVAAADI